MAVAFLADGFLRAVALFAVDVVAVVRLAAVDYFLAVAFLVAAIWVPPRRMVGERGGSWVGVVRFGGARGAGLRRR